MDTVLIAAASGRALAASARRGGYAPLVADYFGDRDTIALARAHVRLDGGLASGMEADVLLDALAKLAVDEHPLGVVCGTGFEDRPQLLERIAEHWRLIGNTPATMAAVKDPAHFARLCGDCGIAHPEISPSRPDDPAGWLVKRRGGSGGSHIRPAADHAGERAGRYCQRQVAGTPVSVLFLADGSRALALGFSTQWPAPTPRQPFRYGGAARPATLGASVDAALTAAVHRIVAALPLVGLNSADFLVDGSNCWLLEVNPRPGATLDLFEPAQEPGQASLFALHVAACARVLPERAPIHDGAMATAIVYADRDMHVSALNWPDWTADRPQAGTIVRTGEPFCTVLARATTAAEAKRLVDQRQQAILRADARAA